MILLKLEKEVGALEKKLDKLGLFYTVYGQWLIRLRKEV